MRYFLLFGLFFTCLGITYASAPLQTQLRAAKHDSARLRLCTELALYYCFKKNFDSSSIYTQLGLELAKKLNNTRYYSDLYRCKALYFRSKMHYEQAIKMALVAIDFGKKNRQYATVELAGYLLAVIYADNAYKTGSKQEQIKAIRQLFNNIRFSNQHQSFTQIDDNYSLLSDIYADNGNDSLALLYMEKQLPYLKKAKDSENQLYFLYVSLQIYVRKKNIKSTKAYLNKILQFQYKEDDPYQYILISIVSELVKANEFELAFELIQRIQVALKMRNKLATHQKVQLNNDLISIYLHKKNYKLAQQAHQQSNYFSKYEQLDFGQQLQFLINQQQLFEHQKRFEEALMLNKRINTMQDSLISAQYSFELAASEERLEYENKERIFQKQLKIQQLENQRKTEGLKSAKQLQWIFTVLFLLLLVVVAIITLQMRKITQQSTTLKKLNEAKNQLFAIIGHDLRSPILALQGSLERLSQSSTEIQKQLPRINNLLLTTDNLLYWAESQQNSAKYQPQAVALSEIIVEVLALLDASIENAQLHIQNQVPDTAVVKADENHLRIIIRNVVQNAIKFTPAGGSITFNTQQLAQSVQLTIEDTGIGFEQSQKTTSKRSTQLGLRLVRNLLTLNGGSFSIQNHAQQGTVVSITLPISPNMA